MTESEKKTKRVKSMKAWREANRERLKAQEKAWYEANREKRKAWCEANRERIKAYREANREKRLAQKKAWHKANLERVKAYREAHREKNSAYAKAWREANTDNVNARTAKRRSKKLQATPKWLTPLDHDLIEMFYEAAADQKRYGLKIHVDHIIPLQGEDVCGLHIPANLQLLPASENLRKSNKYGKAS